MTRRVVIVAVVALLSVVTNRAHAEEPRVTTWNFDSDAADKTPAGFSLGRTGKGAPGRWVVRVATDAPSGGQVLAQVDADSTDYRFPVAVADSPMASDLRVSVKCKPVSGKVDQACGLVFRYQDENNYYVTRANALEDNVNLYYVKNGRRTEIGGWRGKVIGQTWHELAVTAKGNHIAVEWDGNKIIEKTDDTFSQAGKVGVWTKADSVTEFDNLSLTSGSAR
jgi:hypothetical protein